MIPISDDNPVRRAAVVTWAIIVVCVLTYLWERSLGRDMNSALFVLGFVPANLFVTHATESGYVAVPPTLTIFTSMFLHGGVLHLAGNMLYLWVFGNNVEDALGHLRFVFFYIACGTAAALTMGAIDATSTVPMIGASGAISGVLAAYVLFFPRARVTVIVPLGIIFYPFTITAIWVVGFWFVLQLISAGFSNANEPGTAWWAHVGGFAAGLALTPLFKPRDAKLFGQIRRGPWDR
jgi:membrane associated rhomboid family serine protease